MIKVVNLVSLLAAPIIVQQSQLGFWGWALAVAMFVAVVWAIRKSNKPTSLK